MSEGRVDTGIVIRGVNTEDPTRYLLDSQGPQYRQTEFPGSELTVREGGQGMVILMLNPHGDPVIGKRIVRENDKVLSQSEADVQTLEEFNSLFRFDHPNVVRVLGLGRGESEGFYVLMKYIEGESIEDWMKRPHSVAEVSKLMQNLSDGISHINSKGFVHKDLKPDSARVDGDGNWVIVDCGSVFNLNQKEGKMVLQGTPGYIAPEEYSLGMDIQTDVYYLAGLLFDILTFDPECDREQLNREFMFEQKFPLNSFYQQIFTSRPDLLNDLSDIISKGRDYKLQNRQSSVAEFNNEVQRVFTEFAKNENNS